jgi:tetratricopeptide (TPR) repeat protein
MEQRAVIDGVTVGGGSVDPQYVQGSRPDEIWAHFRSGAVVQTSRDRSRHYPGLAGAAPATLGLYLRADELRLSATHVLDAGCGAGEGLRHLGAAYRRTTGVDRDARALAFARQLAPEAHLVHSDLGSGSTRTEPAQLAYVVDVLGHVERPERFLYALGRRMESARGLLVAEPAATADQCLVPPARRAFSMRGLHSILVRGGFSIEGRLGSQAPFLMIYAVAHQDPAATMLLDAEAQFERGSLQVAEELAKRACQTVLPALRLESLLALARIQVELSRRDAATAALLEARRLDPADARPPAALSRLAQLAGSESQAFALAREATRLDLTEVAAVAALGLLSHKSDPKGALDSWLVAHALAPDHSGIAAHLCDAALRVGDCAVAITVLERLRRYLPQQDSAPNSIVMAWLLAREGRPLQAELEARLAEALEPNSPEIKELRGFLKTLSAR